MNFFDTLYYCISLQISLKVKIKSCVIFLIINFLKEPKKVILAEFLVQEKKINWNGLMFLFS